jgi:hypothetical protein
MFHGAIHNQEVSLRRSEDRLPQWTRREHAPVTKTPGAVDHHDLAITGQTQVLQAIIGNDDVNTVLDERARGCNAIAPHNRHTTRAPGYEHGFVANIPPTRLDAHQARLLPAP